MVPSVGVVRRLEGICTCQHRSVQITGNFTITHNQNMTTVALDKFNDKRNSIRMRTIRFVQ